VHIANSVLNEVRCGAICRKVRTQHRRSIISILTFSFSLMSLISPKFHNLVFYINFTQCKLLRAIM